MPSEIYTWEGKKTAEKEEYYHPTHSLPRDFYIELMVECKWNDSSFSLGF